ncbi:OsmC family protein [Streptomyces sp. NPDC055722]
MRSRSVRATWEEGLRCTVDAGGFPLTVDEPRSVGGSDQGPQPTDLLLASVSSCFTVALAYCAARQGVELVDLRVTATGVYDGPRFASVRIEVSSGCERAALTQLITAAEKVCYVTNTLRRAPEIEVALAEERNRAEVPDA